MLLPLIQSPPHSGTPARHPSRSNQAHRCHKRVFAWLTYADTASFGHENLYTFVRHQAYNYISHSRFFWASASVAFIKHSAARTTRFAPQNRPFTYTVMNKVALLKKKRPREFW